MDLEQVGINAGNWVDSAQDRNYWIAPVNAALCLRVPYAMELVSESNIVQSDFLEHPVRLGSWAYIERRPAFVIAILVRHNHKVPN